ncbi:MAG: HI0074 family nucleotidyltransferase substrate-binding subunit [Proteobacteria bacterium]|nr:HI0074 family nucleotidyltransferase substrate-binding subunit [Pseudomonadota bacterium]
MTSASDIDLAILIESVDQLKYLKEKLREVKRRTLLWPCDLVVCNQPWFEIRKEFGGVCDAIHETGIKHSLENLENALAQLEQFIGERTGRKIEKAGIIHAFEFSNETFWNFFQKLAAHQGLSPPMPLLAIAAAYQLGLIQDEGLWLKLMKDRNRTTLTYNEQVAGEIHDAIVLSYAPEMMRTLEAARVLKLP